MWDTGTTPTGPLCSPLSSISARYAYPTHLHLLSSHSCWVCSRWRSVCHCTPKLWRVLPQRFEKTSPTPDLDVELVSLWCLRASPYSMDLTLQGTHAFPIPSLPTSNCAARIGTLRIRALDTGFPPLPTSVSATLSFPCLESLSLTVTSLHRPDYKSNILPLIERLNAPRLSHLTLCINHTVPDIQNFGSGLRELRLELRSPRHSESEAAFPGRNIFAILKNCPRLVSLKLCIEFRDRIDGHDGHLVLRELESLEIYYFDERDDMVVPFSVLTLPKLKGLDIWFPGEFTWDRQAMQSFKNRSDFSLRRLILGHCRDDIPLDDRWEFVGDMNTLEELSIVTYVYGFELLQSLLPHNNEIQQYPLPNLRVLEVIIWNSDEEPSSETDEIVESLVKSRWWTDPAQRSYRRWAKVHIAKDGVLADFYPDVDMEIVSPETKQRMKAIGSGELSLDFDYGYPTLHL
ncbi:hypothetical protein PM082_013381 [Marasmius tenuissimus]|nr:hypothetical protein PM082_013381 [Marasmius tenuissimus]